MKAISVRQPWAWLIVNGHKDIENRVWETHYRGPVLIHAGKQMADKTDIWIIEEMCEHLGIDLPESYEKGGIVGYAEIVDCTGYHKSPWFEGPSGFVLANARPLPFSPLRGQLKFFNVAGLNADQVGALLDKSPVTVRQLARAHEVGQKIGRDWVFTEADIAELTAIPGPGRPRKKEVT